MANPSPIVSINDDRVLFFSFNELDLMQKINEIDEIYIDSHKHGKSMNNIIMGIIKIYTKKPQNNFVANLNPIQLSKTWIIKYTN